MGKQIELKIPYQEKRKKREAVFEINITPNIFNLEYPLFMDKNTKIMALNSRFSMARLSGKATEEELQDIQDELGGMNLESILEDKYKLVGYILKANGYDFDKELWHELADPGDVNHFIVSCAAKDIELYPKKKVKNTDN